MRHLMDYLDRYVLGPINYIDRIEGIVRGLIWGDALTGEKIGIVRIDRGGSHTLNELEEILAERGVKVRGRTHNHHSMYAIVKGRQKRWFYYIAQAHGIKLSTPVPSEYISSRRTPVPSWAEKAAERKRSQKPKTKLGKVREWLKDN